MVMTHVDGIPGKSVKLNTIDKHFKNRLFVIASFSLGLCRRLNSKSEVGLLLVALFISQFSQPSRHWPKHTSCTASSSMYVT